MSMSFGEIQFEATKEAMKVKREHEIEVATRRVEALAEQVYDRATRLMDLASEVRYQSGRATEEPMKFPAGAFGHDTETLDDLVRGLHEESQALATMRTAAEVTGEMQTRYEGLLREEKDRLEATGEQPDPETEFTILPAGDLNGTYL